jgi:hypothetical protein
MNWQQHAVMRGSTLIQVLWLATLLSARCEVTKQDNWGSSSTEFSFVHELAHGEGSSCCSIVIPGNHSVAGEPFEHEPPMQLNR